MKTSFLLLKTSILEGSKLKKHFKVLILFASLFFVINQSFAQVTAIYAGGPIYRDRSYSINELKNSGFNTVIVWTIHIESNGDLGFNGEFPLVQNGTYVGNNQHPNFPADIQSLKQSPTSITRVEFGLSAAGSGTFDAVRDFYNSEGFGPGTTLYENFRALRDAIPGIDAFNNDDEGTYHLASAVAFTRMLADLGFKNAIVPYTRFNFWRDLVSQVNQTHPGNIDRNYLQCYAGGSGNNPCSWNFGIPVIPGLWGGPSRTSPSGVESQMQTWENNCSNTVGGGFMWIYDDFDNSPQVAQYATAINNVFSSTPPPPPPPPTGVDHTDPVGTGTITARASINSQEDASKAFDNRQTSSDWSKWLDNGGTPSSSNPSWIQIELPNAVVADVLAIVSANDDFGRDPEDFNLQGSNNGSNWTTLGSWTGEAFAGRFQRREFSFSNTASYRFFRLNITKNDQNTSLTQLCEVEIRGPGSSTPPPPPTSFLDFNNVSTTSYSNQDASSSVQVQDGGSTLFLSNNTWRRTNQTFNITSNTVLEFEFRSNSQGEIHGIGLDEDNNLSSNRIFKLYGTQNWGINGNNYTTPGSYQQFSIPVGQSFTGSAMYLVFSNDNDAGSGNNSYFRNVRLYESNNASRTTNQPEELPVGNEIIEEASWNVYPNPAGDNSSLRYHLETDADVAVKITSISGETIASYSHNKQESGWHEINLESLNSSGKALNPGIYIIEIITEEYKTVKRIVKY